MGQGCWLIMSEVTAWGRAGVHWSDKGWRTLVGVGSQGIDWTRARGSCPLVLDGIIFSHSIYLPFHQPAESNYMVR